MSVLAGTSVVHFMSHSTHESASISHFITLLISAFNSFMIMVEYPATFTSLSSLGLGNSTKNSFLIFPGDVERIIIRSARHTASRILWVTNKIVFLVFSQ